ncbi:hypothetical protein [Enterovibrio sp. 27052020O]|uniref:hypothetical protein n=1 Tax=Enterovibrio sp. 27052020O TaxID=3241166 RepID=UPI00388CFFB1
MQTKLLTPKGIRVWQGYRSQKYNDDTDGFLEQLGQIFIPATVQLMMPLGLKMYYPAIVPQRVISPPITLPDEIALVGYPSAKNYDEASHHSVAGRAYSSLHETVFNFSPSSIPTSFSSFPCAYSDHAQFAWKTPYYFSGEAIDWHACYVGVIIWTWPEGSDSDHYALGMMTLKTCDESVSRSQNLFEVITVLQKEYGILWFASDTLHWPDRILHTLSDLQCSVVMKAFHDIVNISPLFSENDPGIDAAAGQALDVRLST